MNWKKDIPGWVVIIVVLLTAAVTAWAMLQNGRNLGWNGDPTQPYPPRDLVKLLSPGVAIAEGNMMNVAAVGEVPAIAAGSVPIHGDRGVCTSCHTVLDSRGSKIPVIGARATMPHAFRGVCSNCHMLNGAAPGGAGPWGPGVLRQNPLATNGGNVGAGQGAATTATEGEWLGIEVAPITKLTASQYGIPQDVSGLVVPEAEAQAATAGIKAGDVIVSVNGVPTRNITDFFRATKNGTLASGEVEILRRGQLLRAQLGGQQTNGGGGAVPQPWSRSQPPAIGGAYPDATTPAQQGNVPVGLLGPGTPGYGMGAGQGRGLGWGQGPAPGRTCPAQM